MILDMLKFAAKASLSSVDNDPRNFWLGAAGVRHDGVIVSARNGAAVHTDGFFDNQMISSVHAEGRLLRKWGKGGVIYVARVSKLTKKLAMSRPCGYCQAAISARHLKKVFYSINEKQYGCWDVASDTDKVYTEENEIQLDL